MGALGVLQYVLNEPLLLEASLGARNLNLQDINYIWGFHDQTRAFGLFYSNGYYAFVLNLAVLLTYALALSQGRKWGRWGWFLLFLGLLGAEYMALTRTGLVQTGVGIVLIHLIRGLSRYSAKGRRVLIASLVVTVVSAAALLTYAAIAVGGASNPGGLGDSQSLGIRYRNWQQILSQVRPEHPEFWWGQLLTANDLVIQAGKLRPAQDLTNSDEIIVDNGYIANLLFGGVIFVLLVLAIHLLACYDAVRAAVRLRSIYSTAMAAFLISALIYNIFGTMNDMILLVVIYYYLTRRVTGTQTSGKAPFYPLAPRRIRTF